MQTVTDIMKGLEQLEVKMGQLHWTQFTTGYDFGIQSQDEEIMAYLKNEDYFKVIQDYKKTAESDLEKRMASIAYKTFEPYHKSEAINQLQLKISNKVTELMQVLNTFRFTLDGKEITSVELSQILMSESDRSKRKAAYLARNQVNQPLVDAGFLDLISMRKELAKLSGFDSFVDMSLYNDDLDPAIFSGWKEQLEEMRPELNEKRSVFAKKYLDDDTIQPWDYAYIGAQIAPSTNKQVDMSKFYDVVKAFFSQFNFDLDAYGIVYDVFSRKNKSEWGYFFPIELGHDARILANVKDRFYEFNVLLHETGHGIHFSTVNPEDTIINRGISGIIEEGIANMFGEQIYNEAFFGQFFETDIETARAEFEAYRNWRKINAFNVVSNIMFDQNFYKQDLNNLTDIYEMYWQTRLDYLGSERGDYEPPWAVTIHHTSHPIYLHNYFMGDVTAEMVQSVFCKQHNISHITEMPEAFGAFLLEKVIQPSGRYTYSQLFERISGEGFSFKYLLD